jgi:protein-tyrosine phosphatase
MSLFSVVSLSSHHPLSVPAINATPSRSAINRDLTADLERIASLNVKLIINCLSDEELSFLGSPWPQYVSAAHKLGIDVLRIPMPEGMAPLNVEDVDREMERVIALYTIKGIDVLAHCRGGIGRVKIPMTYQMSLCLISLLWH